MVGEPHPVMGGSPSSHGGGILGTPHPPSRPGQGVPWVPPTHHPDLDGGTPGTPYHPEHAGGVPQVPPTIQTWSEGYPGYPPPSRPGQGTPHHQDLNRVPPTIQTWLGYPHHHQDLAGIAPPPVKVWTDKQTENSTFPHPSDAGGNNRM